MKSIRVLVVLAAAALAAGACSREGNRRVAAPEAPRDPSGGIEAHWVEGADLARAVSLASGSPLVARALISVSEPGLRFERAYAIRATGATAGGLRCGVTLLPYAHADDPTIATFIALMDRAGAPAVQAFDLIVGREPTWLEAGFATVDLPGGGRGWIRERDDATGTAAGAGNAAPERLNARRWATCFFGLAPGWCDAGARIAKEVAPMVPWATAVGCGVGVAAAAIACIPSGMS